MELRNLGKSDIKISILGYGAGHIGGDNRTDKEIEILLNQIIDNGINFIDTARGYGNSEERIGKLISNRRSEYVLSTKVGYGIEGIEDWTYECVVEGVNRALKVMKTDYIDVVHLHSCDINILKKGEVIDALIDSQKEGKIRLKAYSGENEALEYALNTNVFEVIQTSVNLFDQRGINQYIPKALEKNIGVIAKRPIANAPWKYEERPYNNYCEEYWVRMKKMNLNLEKNFNMNEIALRFAAYTKGITTCIAGSTNIEHILQNIKYIEKGELEEEIYKIIIEKFNENYDNWVGQI